MGSSRPTETPGSGESPIGSSPRAGLRGELAAAAAVVDLSQMSKGEVANLQACLNGLGYSAGEEDGIAGPITRAAASNFIEDVGARGINAPHEILSHARRKLAQGALRRSDVTVSPLGRQEADRLLKGAGHVTTAGNANVRDAFAALWAAHQQTGNPEDPDHLVATVARWFESQQVSETSENRGPWVDPIVLLGGGDPERRSPWCAYFVGCCRVVARWLWDDIADAEPFPPFKTSGGAVRTWQKASLGSGMTAAAGTAGVVMFPVSAAAGSVYARLRTSLPADDVEATLRSVWEGGSAQGHTGVVVEVVDGGLLAIGGHSSGAGHSRSRSGGRVAYEFLSPDGDESARKAWARLVGLSWVG